MSNNANNVTLTWIGIDELYRDLREAPAAIRTECDHIIEGVANRATHQIKQIYGKHRVTGHLVDSVFVEKVSAGPNGVAYVVRVADPIAWLFDNGSQARHWIKGSRKSVGTMWGKTPPQHPFVRTMSKARQSMFPLLKAVLERYGATVKQSG